MKWNEHTSKHSLLHGVVNEGVKGILEHLGLEPVCGESHDVRGPGEARNC